MNPFGCCYLWYNMGRQSQPTRPPQNGWYRLHTTRIIGRVSPAACSNTPQPRAGCAILNCRLRVAASHGRTDRPSAWQGALRPRCIPRPRRAFVPSCGTSRPKEPSRSLGTHDQGAVALGTRRGAIAPLDHSPETVASRHPRPELSRSGRRAGGCHAPAPRRGDCAPSTTRAGAL